MNSSTSTSTSISTTTSLSAFKIPHLSSYISNASSDSENERNEEDQQQQQLLLSTKQLNTTIRQLCKDKKELKKKPSKRTSLKTLETQLHNLQDTICNNHMQIMDCLMQIKKMK